MMFGESNIIQSCIICGCYGNQLWDPVSGILQNHQRRHHWCLPAKPPTAVKINFLLLFAGVVNILVF